MCKLDGMLVVSQSCPTLCDPMDLPGEFHEQRSLVGYSPPNCKDLDTTESLNAFRQTSDMVWHVFLCDHRLLCGK